MQPSAPFFIFLDFDGVLHGNHGESFEHNKALQGVIEGLEKAHPGVTFKIVVSSSWREIYKVTELEDFLEGMVKWFAGTTPCIARRMKNKKLKWARRQDEIEAWLAVNEHSGFVILDDVTKDFDRKHKKHVAPDAEKGLMPEDFARMIAIVEEQLDSMT